MGSLHTIHLKNMIMIRSSVTILFLLAIINVHVSPAEVKVTENLGPECFDCKCPRNLDYQCGSDGRSYMNECLFQCAQEKCGEQTRGVVITRRGHCHENEL